MTRLLSVYLIPAGFLLALGAYGTEQAPSETVLPQASPPNILLVMTDDQGWGDVGAHGNDRIDTPSMDRLAREGARFDRFYVSPVCAPTRASLLTGRYDLRTGTAGVTRGLETMRADEVTIAEVLGAAGYATGLFGKWHNGAHYPHDPLGQGFDTFVGFNAGHWNNYFDTHLTNGRETIQTEGYITDVLTDAAIEFVEAHAEEPFLAYVAYNTPHGPFQVPEAYFEKYKARGFDDRTAAIYGMVENADDNLGRLLGALDRLDLADDTIVLFLTDNGPNGDRYNGGMRGRKGHLHEGGVRVPLFVRWPGRIEAGRLVEPLAAHIDLLPTLVDLTGAGEKPGGLDGQSLAPLLLGEAEAWPERTLFQRWADSRDGVIHRCPGAARTPRYRAVCTPAEDWMLFDMHVDPSETNDLSAERPALLGALRDAYYAWFEDVTATPIERLPVPVGHGEAPLVEMPITEAYFDDGLGYRGGDGWANDWLTGWTDERDAIWWELDVQEEGTYEVSALYTLAAENEGAQLQVRVGGETAAAVLAEAHDPEPLPSPDRVPRKEVYEKAWGEVALGRLRLGEGAQTLRLEAPQIPGAQAPDVFAVRVRKVQ